MASSYVFNPFTSNFDQISTITLAAVGSVPNANGASLTGQILTLQPADATNPGIVSAATVQFFGGGKYYEYIQTGGTATSRTNLGTGSTMVIVGKFLSAVAYGFKTASYIGYSANGTEAVPLAVTTNDLLSAFGCRGHNGTGFSGTRINIRMIATEPWTTTTNGCSMLFITTANTTVSTTTKMTLTGAGDFGIGISIPTERLHVVGNILASGTITATGAMAASNLSGTNTGDVTLGVVGSVPNATASTIVGQVLNLEPADATFPGVVTTGTQSFAGAKTFTGAITASNLSGTNTGNVTLVAVGSTPSANGASLTGQVLNLEPADATFPGVVTTGTQSFAGAKTFTGAIAASNLSGTNTGDQTITLTGDVTGSGTSSFAATIANNAVTNALAAQMPTLTIKGNNTGGTANALDLTVGQVNTMLGTVVNPMTTIGDVIQAAVSGVPQRLARGTANQVLQVQGSATSVSWQGIYQDSFPNYIAVNPNFEVDVTGWVTYADAAATTPANGIGGSPVTTFTRTTSLPLRGTASGMITKDAANRQGEGASYDFTIDSIDVNKTLIVQFDYVASAAFVVGSSSDVTVWLYDVTNSALITPSPINIMSASGTFVASFQTSSSTSYRLIYHISTTNAQAWALKIDNVIVSAKETVFASVIGPWQSNLTFLASSFGTVTSQNSFYRLEGDSLHARITFNTGTTVSAAATITLPSGYVIDNAKMPTNSSGTTVGNWDSSGGATNGLGSNDVLGPIFYDGSDTEKVYFANQYTTTGLIKGNGNSVGFNTGQMTLEFTVPIVGLQSSAASANGRVFNISSIIANGTRVTATPTLLGQYRTYIKDISAQTGTDNAPTGTYVPSAANGMGIDGSVLFGSAGTSGQPTRWEIFVGKNKTINFQWYQTTGRAGYISVDFVSYSSNTIIAGVNYGYDPTTGIAFMDAQRLPDGATTTTRRAGTGFAINGGGSTTFETAYFDVIVSENALAVTANPVVGSGYMTATGSLSGSYSTITYTTKVYDTNGAYSGGIYTVAVTGIYQITASIFIDNATTAINDNWRLGIAVNSTGTPTITGFYRVPSALILDGQIVVTGSLRLNAGDLIRVICLSNSTSPSIPGAGNQYEYFNINLIGQI